MRVVAVLLSMTGYGEARLQASTAQIMVELRSVNNRYFKLSLKAPEALAAFESDLDKLLREQISRGTVSLAIRLEHGRTDHGPRINREVLQAFYRELSQLARDWEAPQPNLTELLTLPDVVQADDWNLDTIQTLWPQIAECTRAALYKYQQFRIREGAAMAADLRINLRIIQDQLELIANFAPQVVSEYRDKILLRVQELLKGTDASIAAADVIREVSLFADRCDINEEIARLRSHFSHFDAFLNESTSQGRKLEFLCQELFREINTIGSKANHVQLQHAAVEMKAAVEKIREVLQNVE